MRWEGISRWNLCAIKKILLMLNGMEKLSIKLGMGTHGTQILWEKNVWLLGGWRNDKWLSLCIHKSIRNDLPEEQTPIFRCVKSIENSFPSTTMFPFTRHLVWKCTKYSTFPQTNYHFGVCRRCRRLTTRRIQKLCTRAFPQIKNEAVNVILLP